MLNNFFGLPSLLWKRELSGWIQVHLRGSSPSLILSNGAEMNKQRIPKHLYFWLNIAQCQIFAESEKNSEIDKSCGRQTNPLQAAPLYCTSSNAHLHPGLACSALPPHPLIPQITPPCRHQQQTHPLKQREGSLAEKCPCQSSTLLSKQGCSALPIQSSFCYSYSYMTRLKELNCL